MRTEPAPTRSSALRTAAAGLAVNLSLGVLFAWSLFSRALAEPVSDGGFGWNRTLATLPYTIACAFFALLMVPAGRWQDRYGPRVVAGAGALSGGLGLILAGFGRPDSPWPVILGFGVFLGGGIGLGYAAATPAVIKWFPPERKGLMTGLVVGGLGLAPVYMAPLAEALIGRLGIAGAFRVLAFLPWIAGGLASRLLVNPPPGYVPAPVRRRRLPVQASPAPDKAWQEVLHAPRFWSLYLQMLVSAAAGLMIIGHAARIIMVQSDGDIRAGFLFVALLAVFNAGGRVAAGFISDLWGRRRTMTAVFLAQAAVLLAFGRLASVPGFVFGFAAAGFLYGSGLSLFPATVSDQWGLLHMGRNYGLLFTGWGLGGILGPTLAGLAADGGRGYAPVFRAAGLALLAAAALAGVPGLRRRRPPL